jgi:hypothetical protein
VVRGIEARRGDVAEGADGAPVVRGAERVAAVLDEPESVRFGERGDCRDVEWIAERMRDHDRARAVAEGGLQHVEARAERGNRDVDEDGHESVLKDRIHRGREACRDGDDLIAAPDLPVPECRRRECGERDEVCRGSRVHEGRLPRAEGAREVALEHAGEAAGGEPEVEARIHQMPHVLCVEHLA